MPAIDEAARLNLDYYRKQSKALLKSARLAEPAAVERLARHSTWTLGRAPALHDAQLAIAREQGFPSWPRFRSFIVQSRLDFHSLASAFIDAAVSDLNRANSILSAHPTISGAGLYTALVLGDWRQVELAIKESQVDLNAKSGPQNCVPLAYACWSRYASPISDRSADVVQTSRVLLANGADPNVLVVTDDLPDNPLSCLYAAVGINNNPALARLLLEAGANPNDGESLYHSIEHPDLECMKLLLEYGASPDRANALKRILDREEIDGLKLLLAAGASPNVLNAQSESALHWAVWRARSVDAVALLLDSGAQLNARRYDGRTAYALAVISGQTASAELLRARGADTNLSDDDRFIGSCVSADPAGLSMLLGKMPNAAASPALARLVPDLAGSRRTSAVRSLLAAGFPVDARGDLGATALHWACWKGYSDLAGLLLEHGASLAILDEQFQGTPAGWFAHGIHNCHEGDGDYAGVARALISAGAEIPKQDLPTGDPSVDAVLREQGIIK